MNHRVSRRHFLSAIGATTAGFALNRSINGQEKKNPNVILCMTDDQGWGDIHSHGNEKLDTPVMDFLGDSGARFERFYVSPVCAPTRASLLTGRYHLRAGVHGVTRGKETMRSEEVTLGEVFQAAGYKTGCFGKWHNGAHYPNHPNGQGFDEFFGFCAGHWNNYFNTTLDHNGKIVETEGYITDVLTDEALKFIDKDKNQPFFCYLPYNAPHSPWQVPDKYFDKYKQRGFDDKTACAYGMVENIDDNLKRVLDRLEKHNLTEDTIILFTTDNGPNSDRYNGNMKGRKGSTHEGGVRVPLFVRWPGKIKAGTVVEPIAAHIDILPTLVELCDIPMPDTLPLDGVSVAPLLLKKDVDWEDRMIFNHWGNRGSVRTQRWRAVYERGNWSLYDMKNDPDQTKNVASEHPELMQKYKQAYEKWYKDVTKKGFDPIPIPIGYAESPEVIMPGHEAYLHPGKNKGISYDGRSGWANDWVTNWTDTDAYPYWEIDVVNPGYYEITLMYVCSKENVGAKVRVEAADVKIEGTIEKPHNPAPFPSPDRVPRKEVYEKEWAPLKLGRMRLPEGKTQLRVKALSKPGQTVMDLKAVKVRRARD